jgi:hypothetical protein
MSLAVKKPLVIKKCTFKNGSDTHPWLSFVVSAKKIRILGSNHQSEAVQQTSNLASDLQRIADGITHHTKLQMPSHITQNCRCHHASHKIADAITHHTKLQMPSHITQNCRWHHTSHKIADAITHHTKLQIPSHITQNCRYHHTSHKIMIPLHALKAS